MTPAALAGLAAGLVPETDPALLGPSVAPPVTPGIPTNVLSLRGMGPGQDGPATIAAAQTGYFDCQWANADRSTTVVLEVLPQAAAAFTAEKAAPPASQPTVPFSDLDLGDETFGYCYPADVMAVWGVCRLNLLEGSTWYRVTITGQSSDQSATASSLGAVAQSASDAIAATGTEPAPLVQPASHWSTTAGCVADNRRSRSDSEATPPGFDLEQGTADRLLHEAVAIAAGFECTVGTASTRTATVIPGAAWVWPTTYTSPITTDVELTVTGVPEARFRCGPTGGAESSCWAEGVIDGAFVVVVDGSRVTDSGTQARDAEGLAELAVANSAG
ncbi:MULTISPECIES: hypothetical protein [unclassified Cryobacterium]|uniref:hypothetical protein n=1 Tax=unclassified Cryobacterium TaxID=2649013 RepID=UPI002AB57CA5|nr:MULTISPECIES: hypothetical protein [unclassified Cryobacterium]MDY7543790.1 hypothetical protein [Cryobacterium sp. 5B3]MEA9997596.1 hypothetical protein [Cryobacterium sp. RTS3]MEB0264240.1 hypothetical protein [Cryobacterium sp. 10I5]MEB0275203.1 hypothetical protein [Cryobacterium sp. 5B3]